VSGAAGLAVLLALGLLVTELPVTHTHAAEESGWYDQQCPLERLAAGLAALPLEPSLVMVRVPAAADDVPARDPARSHPVPRAFAARAPPRAS
jgi:hypothetical protein